MNRIAQVAVLAVAVVLASVLFGADPAPKMDEPVVVTRAMLADLIFLTADSDRIAFTYEPGNLVVSYKEEDVNQRDAGHEAAYAEMAKKRPASARKAAAYAISRILPMIQKCVDPNAKVVYRGF